MRNAIPQRNVQRMQFATNNQRGNKGNYLNNYIPYEIWSKMSRADQLEHIKKNCAIREQNQRSKEGQSDAPRPQTNYGKQYAIPVKMAKMATNPERISEEYTNIWGPPLTTEGGMQTMKTSKTAQVNFIRTIKPQPQKLFQDLEVCQMTFGIGGEVKVHVNYEDKAQVFSYKFAKKYFPERLAHYVLANQLELLNGLEWVGRYKSPDLDNIRAREKRISLLRNTLRMTST